MANKRRRTLPPLPAKIDPQLRAALEPMREIAETGEGVRGHPLDRKVTLRDLIDTGLGKLRDGVHVGKSGTLVPGSVLEPSTPAPNMAVPPKARGFSATGGFWGSISLTWDHPQDYYGNHGYTNIYRADEDNFANATLIGREVGTFYSDQLRTDTVGDDAAHNQGAYYWITWVSETGVEGPPNDTSGTYAAPLQDVTTVLKTLSNNLQDEPTDLGAPDETLILNARRFALKVGSGDDATFPFMIQNIGGTDTTLINTAIIGEASIQRGQIGPISFGTITDDNGDAVTTVGGKLKANNVDTDNLSVSQAATFYGDAFSDAFESGSSGWCLLQSGYAELNNAMIRGNLEVQSITVNGQSPFGAIQGQVGRNSKNWSYNRYDDEGDFNPSLSTSTASDSITEMPKGSRINIQFFPLSSISVSGSLGYTTTIQPGDGGHSTFTQHGSLKVTIKTRIRLWVDGNKVMEKTLTLLQTYYDDLLTGVSASATLSRDDAVNIEYTYPAYKSTSHITGDVYVYAAAVDDVNAFSGSLQLQAGGLIFSGDIYRLG